MLIHAQDELKIVRELHDQSDRGAALIAAAWVDAELEGLIEARLLADQKVFGELFNPNGPIGAFATKVRLGYMLGLITDEVRKDLRTIGRIRNKFAHVRTPLSFETQEIRQLCDELTPCEYPDNENNPDGPPRFKRLARPLNGADARKEYLQRCNKFTAMSGTISRFHAVRLTPHAVRWFNWTDAFPQRATDAPE